MERILKDEPHILSMKDKQKSNEGYKSSPNPTSSEESSDSEHPLNIPGEACSEVSEPQSAEYEKDFTDHALVKTASDRRMETAYSNEDQNPNTTQGGKKLNPKNQGFVPNVPV